MNHAKNQMQLARDALRHLRARVSVLQSDRLTRDLVDLGWLLWGIQKESRRLLEVFKEALRAEAQKHTISLRGALPASVCIIDPPEVVPVLRDGVTAAQVLMSLTNHPDALGELFEITIRPRPNFEDVADKYPELFRKLNVLVKTKTSAPRVQFEE